MLRATSVSFIVLLFFGTILLAQVDPAQNQPQPAVRSMQQASNSPAFQQAMKVYRQGRYSDAIAAFQSVIASEPDNAAAYYFLGYASYVSGHHAEAVTAFGKAFEIDPNFDPRPFFHARR